MRHSIVSTLLISLALLAPHSQAQPIGEGVMADLDVYTGAECEPEIAVVQMNIPIRYISHFPRSTGSQVKIRLRPLRVSALDADQLNERESRSPAFRRATLLREATFEGDIQGGPFLSLRFREKARFHIFQGHDYRSIWVVVSPASFAAGSPCQHSLSHDARALP